MPVCTDPSQAVKWRHGSRQPVERKKPHPLLMPIFSIHIQSFAICLVLVDTTSSPMPSPTPRPT
eukprot:2136951-Pyramimonas_sp.AAC.1